MLETLTDEQREQRIKELGDAIEDAQRRREWPEAKRLWHAMKAEINARSPEQVRRMEAEKGLK